MAWKALKMLAFLESLYLFSVAQDGAESPGALATEVSADDDYSKEMELHAYRSALKLLVADIDPALEPPMESMEPMEPMAMQPSWSRVESAADSDSGSHALPS
jgi:hypothetical protein